MLQGLGPKEKPSNKLAGAVSKGLGAGLSAARSHDWRKTAKAGGQWAKSRPYHLLPWIALAAAVGLWPKPAPPPEPVPAPKPAPIIPGLSEERQMSAGAFEADEPGRGRTAWHPHRIPLIGWRDIVWRTVVEIGVDKLPSVAGGVTFYALLAIFPAIGAFVSLYGLFADIATVQKQLAEMSGVFPASVVQIVGDQMLRLAGQHDGKLTVAFVISLLLSVWSANAGMKALFEGLNVAYDESEKRPFFRQTLVSYICTLGALVFLSSVAGLLVALPLAFKALGMEPLLVIWETVRWLAVLALAALAFTLLYRVGPSRARARWQWLSWGAVAASVMWLGGSLGFTWYVNTLAHFDATYGPLGAVIAFMMWVWFSVMTILIGAELNAEIEHQTARDSTTGPARPMGKRGAAMADTVGQTISVRDVVQKERDAVAGLAKGVWAKVRPNKPFSHLGEKVAPKGSDEGSHRP